MAGRRALLDPTVKLSKALSYLLRHGAEKEGFKLLPGGFLYVDEILKHRNFKSASVEEIQKIVESNDKKRFTLQTDPTSKRLMIRANQGHSLKVDDLELQPITDPVEYPVVIHGTDEKAFKIIAKEGLRPMGRNQIHFAAGEPGEDGVISGMRRSCTVVIYINIAKALADGFKFYLSANNVILCSGNESGVIPPEYFDRVILRKSGEMLSFKGSSLPSSEDSATAVDEHNTAIQSKEATAVTADEIAEGYDRKKNKRKNKNKKKSIDE